MNNLQCTGGSPYRSKTLQTVQLMYAGAVSSSFVDFFFLFALILSNTLLYFLGPTIQAKLFGPA